MLQAALAAAHSLFPAPVCVRMHACRWEVEEMAVDGLLYPRTAGDAVPLPNGRVLVLNGNKVGAPPPFLQAAYLRQLLPCPFAAPLVRAVVVHCGSVFY